MCPYMINLTLCTCTTAGELPTASAARPVGLEAGDAGLKATGGGKNGPGKNESRNASDKKPRGAEHT